MMTYVLWFCLAGKPPCQPFVPWGQQIEYLAKDICEVRKDMLNKGAKLAKEHGDPDTYTYECRQQSPPAK